MTQRLLIVDDSRAMRAFVRGSLRSALPYDVDEASSGFEALRLLPRGDYAAVITDINMPDINGLELIRFVRRSERHGKIPIVIISTQSGKRDEERALELGADTFLAKPFQPEEIVAAVRRCLQGRDS